MIINKEGTSRIVVIVPKLGIVLKIARINLLKAIFLILIAFGFERGFQFNKVIKIKVWLRQRKYYFKHGIFGPTIRAPEPSLSYFLFRGLACNLSEFIYYLRNRNNNFLIPTYFSIFGIVNIQSLQKDVCNSDDKVFQHLTKFTERNELFKHSPHTFAEQSNFCVDKEGKLCVLDYAAKGLQKMAKKYGDRFHSPFERTG